MLSTRFQQVRYSLRPCPLCGVKDFVSLFTDINRREGLPISATLVQCRGCSMRFINPVPDAASLARFYSDGAVDPVALDPVAVQPAPRMSAPVGQLRSIVRSINGLLRGHPHDWPGEDGHGRSILDFGCYDGVKLTYWYQRGWQVAGIDLNEKAIEAAARHFPRVPA